ncbi:MAG: DNA-3-methyladenine glycosylase 2 family protein [Haloarculaceae archaeon]
MSREAADHLRTDHALAPLVEQHGPLDLSPADDIFERFVVSIIRQQVSMDAAAAIRERLFERVAVTPATIRAADADVLREAGLSAAKVEYVKAVADRFAEREYDRSYFADYSDDAVIAELTDIHGVGPWTAKMFLLFCLGRPDVFPVEDLGIRQGMQAVVGADLTRAEMRERANEWRPYRSYASLYLWRATDG